MGRELTLSQQLAAHGAKFVAQLHEQVVNGGRQLIGRGVDGRSLRITVIVVVVVGGVVAVGGEAVELADELVGVAVLVGGSVGGGAGGVGGCAGWYWDGHGSGGLEGWEVRKAG